MRKQAIVYDPDKHTLSIGSDSTPFTLRTGEALSLHVFIDEGLVEVVANSRASLATSTPLPESSGYEAIHAFGTEELANFEAWSLGGIWD